MSQTVIFIVGVAVFALTIYGAVLGGGIWLGGLADTQDALLGQRLTNDRTSDGVDGTPQPQ